jgi:DNA-binding CsgD family transcriptional regulator/ligand-binding sensor domain-containing protein
MPLTDFVNKAPARTICLFGLLVSFVIANAQNTIGIPSIINYSKETYSAGSQNWGVAQDKNGMIYFANNQGLLSFDGTFWRKYPLPNKTIARSVAVDEDGRVYVGGQSEFGYFYPSKNGSLAYTSLMPLLQEKSKDFTDVWNICIYEGKIFFRAYRKIFEYDHKKITVHDGVQWSFLGHAASSLLAFEINKGLVAYKNGQWLPAFKAGELSAGINIKGTTVIGKDSTLIATLTQGLYILHQDTITKFTSPGIQSITGQNIYGVSMLAPDRIALITNLSGCIVINKKGEIVQRLSKQEGIQNNNVLSLLLDKDRNLWLGLANGIDLILYNNAIKNVFPEEQDKNAGYVSIIHNNKLYLGLASGAYTIALDDSKDLSYTKGRFEHVQGSKGQVWNFSNVNDQLLMGHNGGAFVINNNIAQPIDNKTGFWNFQSLSNNGSSKLMFAGTYNGINFYNYQNGSFSNPGINAHFESARFVVQHNNIIWVAHPFKGLYKVIIDKAGKPSAQFYQDKNHFLSNNHNKIFSVGGRLILTTDNGLFEFDDGKNDFVRSAYFEKLFDRRVSYIKEDKYDNLWFAHEKKLGVIDNSSGKPKKIFIPELNNRIQGDGFEHINIIDSNNVLIAGEKGFFHLNYSQYKRNRHQLNVFVRNVRPISQGDSIIFGGYSKAHINPSLSYNYNSLHFESSSTLFGQEHTLEYSYLLEGFDKNWSDWARKTEKDYTNIPEGDYVFKVKCRNNFDNESAIASFSFTILPPWYRTWWAYGLYAVLFAVVLYLFYKRQQQKYKKQQQRKLQEQQRKYHEEQKQLQMQHQLELSESDKQIAQLRNEKLQAEVEHKNTELATSAMNLVHKVEILSKIKGDLIHFKDTVQVKDSKEFLKLIKVIDTELNSAQEWEQFARHFDTVHTNYLKKLKEYCPDLTASELKLAAYLRLSLSTKEIAQLMNISIRGVETSRYRLRKKLGLTNDEANLYTFLIQLTAEKGPDVAS